MQKYPQDAVIISRARTPIGKHGGCLSDFRADDLLGQTLREAADRTNLPDAEFEEVFTGCANQAGEDNRNVARMALLLGGFPETLPGVTVNRLCASGLEAIIQASRSIRLGDNHLVLAGGVESMSRAPWVIGKPSKGFATGAPEVFDTSLGWRFPNPKLRELFPLESMGETAENLAQTHTITREEQDLFAFESHKKALHAQEKSLFSKSIFEIRQTNNGKEISIVKDEGPRVDATLEKLAALKPIFRKGGTVTAGTSSGLNDGAAAVAICSRDYARAHGIKPIARILGSASAGVNPRFMGIGPVPATKKLLNNIKLSLKDIDLVELNEAFAAQALSVIKELQLPYERVNVFGGALALGHPLGASGTRIVTTLIDALSHTQKCLGIATLCVGVGQGLSLALEME